MRLLAALSLLLVAFAGCADDPAEPEPINAEPEATPEAADPATETETEQEPTEPESDPEVPDRAPTAELSADLVEAEAPASINFTLTGTDDGIFNWTFDADGDGTFDAQGPGTELPLTTNFTFTDAGIYNATLTVDDGNQTMMATLQLNITEAATPPAIEPEPGAPCDTVTGQGLALVGTNLHAGAAGIYIAVGTAVEPGIYMESNGIPGLQTVESCPDNHDDKLP